MLVEKKPLDVEALEAQTAMELPARELMLVTVIIGDVTVDLPVAIAANVCDVDVNVLAQQLEQGDTTCTASSDANA